MSNGIQFSEKGPKLDKEEIYERKPGFGMKLANLIVKLSGGLIKNEHQANYVLVAVAIVIFLISLVIFYSAL